MRTAPTWATGNGFSQWLGFGDNGVIADNDPEEQGKSMRMLRLIASEPSSGQIAASRS